MPSQTSAGERAKNRKKEKPEGTTGQGTITREQVDHLNPMTAMRFHRGGKTSVVSGLPLSLVWGCFHGENEVLLLILLLLLE